MAQSSSVWQKMALFTKRIIMGSSFEVTSRYSQLEPIGIGISGLVCSAKDQLSNDTVAIKKLVEPFKISDIAKHMFREIKLLKQLQHDNIVHLKDIFISPSEDIYLVTDLMATNLDALLKTKKIDDQFAQYFLYQILRGLKYVHSAGVIHRDLKPTNILINENCDLKICDFGLARMQENRMTGYVSTRYYRAPEVMLTFRRYTEKVDIWSVGCIFAEMMLGRPIFPGKNHVDQFCIITQLLGSPPDNVIANVTNLNTLSFLKSLPQRARKPVSKLIPSASPHAAALLEKMLEIDPEERCYAAEGLTMRYLAPYHDPDDEPAAAEMSDCPYLDADMPASIWKTIIYSEVLEFHENARSPASQLQPEAMDLS